jgi:hypothetical protein
MSNRGQNNQTGVNVGFTGSTVDFEQASDVDDSDGISMAEFDGREEPTHARKVSVRKPEIIALFEYHPMFREIMQGDDQEMQRVLTDAGKYIDTQITARKIRLDDIKVLFEQLSKDPESPTGQIVENLIGVLESKITDVKNDFEAIKTVSDTVLQFLDTLDLRRQSTSQQSIFEEVRKRRFEENPLRLPNSEKKTLDFNRMMTDNLGARTSDDPNDEGNLDGSGTKLFLNFLSDIDALMRGTVKFPNEAFSERQNENDDDSERVFSGARTKLYPIVNVTNGYGAGDYGRGRCSLMLEPQEGSPLGHSPSFSANSNAQGIPTRTGRDFDAAAFRDNFYSQIDDPSTIGRQCAYLAQTITDDLSFSSALGNDNFVNSAELFLGDRTGRGNRDRNISLPDAVTGFDIFNENIRQNTVADIASFDEDLRGLVATALYDPDAEGPKAPIRTFDPGTLSVPDDDGVAKRIQNTAYDQLLKPVLETMQEGDNVSTKPLEDFIQSVPQTLSKSADALDMYFASNDPVLNPKSILIKVLANIRKRIPDLNIGEDVDFSNGSTAPMAVGPMIDFCLLAESCRDTKMQTEFQVDHMRTRGVLTYGKFRTNDLLTLFLICLAKTKPNSGKYASVIARQGRTRRVSRNNAFFTDDAGVNYAVIARGLTKHIRMNLTNTYTGKSLPRDADGNLPTLPGDSREYESALAVMKARDYDYAAGTNLVFGPESPGVADENFAGRKFSRSRRLANSIRVTRWSAIQAKLAVTPENNSTFDPPSGGLCRPGSADPEGGRGNLMGTGPFGEVRSGGYFDTSPIKRIYGSQIETRLSEVTGRKRNDSIFADIIELVDEICDAAVARGPIVDPITGKMISSGVDPAYIMSFVISMYARIIKTLLRVQFNPQSSYYTAPADVAEHGKHNLAMKNLWTRAAGFKTMVILQCNNIVNSREFISDLNNFISEEGNIDTLPGSGSPLARFLSEFNNQVDGSTRIRLDAVDILRTLGDSLSSAGNKYIESFVNDKNQIRVDEQFERIKTVLPLAIDRTQVVAMKNQLQSVDRKEGFGRYFDDFMLSQAQENFFYGSLLGLGQGFQKYKPLDGPNFPRILVDDGNRVNFTTDKNIKMLTFGVPQGFSKTVLDVDPVLEPDRFAERLVDVYVVARDHLSGDAISIIPQPYTFDLGLFFDSVSDPVVSSPQTNSQLNEETSPEFLSNFNQSIANRKYPEREEIFQGNIKMRRILMGADDGQVISRPVDVGAQQTVFDNHTYDMLAKTYIKVTTGMSVTENDFFIDTSIESRLATEPDLRNLSNLMNTHISQLLGRDITFNDYLSGDRKFRELLNRLSKGEKTNQIIDEIKVNLEGTTEDANTLSSEDLVAFSRMISSNNPIVTPGIFRDKIVSPRLFERVFSIFINPDKFVALPFPADPARPQRLAQERRKFMNELFGDGAENPAIGSAASEDPVVPSRIDAPNTPGDQNIANSAIGFTTNQDPPIVNMYQVFVVPHGTPVDFFSEPGEE